MHTKFERTVALIEKLRTFYTLPRIWLFQLLKEESSRAQCRSEIKLVVLVDKIRVPIANTRVIHSKVEEVSGLLGTYSRWHEPNTTQCRMSVVQETKSHSKCERDRLLEFTRGCRCSQCRADAGHCRGLTVVSEGTAALQIQMPNIWQTGTAGSAGARVSKVTEAGPSKCRHAKSIHETSRNPYLARACRDQCAAVRHAVRKWATDHLLLTRAFR